MADLSHHSKEYAKQCKTAMRQLLEPVRDGRATKDETAVVQLGIKHMSEHPEHPERPKNKRRLYVLTMRYLTPEAIPLKELATRFNIDKCTAFRDVCAAMEQLSILVFGVNGISWK